MGQHASFPECNIDLIASLDILTASITWKIYHGSVSNLHCNAHLVLSSVEMPLNRR